MIDDDRLINYFCIQVRTWPRGRNLDRNTKTDILVVQVLSVRLPMWAESLSKLHKATGFSNASCK